MVIASQSRRVIQNVSYLDAKNPVPTIRIAEGDAGWQEAYNNWIINKYPTSDPEWKSGAFMHFEPIEEVAPPVVAQPPGTLVLCKQAVSGLFSWIGKMLLMLIGIYPDKFWSNNSE